MIIYTVGICGKMGMATRSRTRWIEAAALGRMNQQKQYLGYIWESATSFFRGWSIPIKQ